MDLNGKTILVTGGTGSFGKTFVRTLLTQHKPKKVIVFSRDELKQFEMGQDFEGHSNLRFFLGDIRDEARLRQAFAGVDIVIHAAALKQVPMLEYNPFEAVKTNILGAENIISAAIDRGVKHLVALSTDKAVNPVNLYGATKLSMEKLFVAGNSYAGEKPTRFSVVRYGNVVGSRGSVIPFFIKKRETGVIPITDARMTRFWITLSGAVDLVLYALDHMHGGEIFIPKIPSMKVMDLAKAIAPDCRHEVIGIRPGEKLHEVLITEDEARHTIEENSCYVIEPELPFWEERVPNGSVRKRVKEGFRYASDNNSQWMTQEQLMTMTQEFDDKKPARAGR